MLKFGAKIVQNIEMIQDIIDEEPFEWSFPEHLKQSRNNNHVVTAQDTILYEWYKNECLPEKPRRRALVLYSKDRGVGKTTFAKSLLGIDDKGELLNPKRIIYCRNTITAADLENQY